MVLIRRSAIWWVTTPATIRLRSTPESIRSWCGRARSIPVRFQRWRGTAARYLRIWPVCADAGLSPARMPELAEVEFYRKQWNPGLGRRIQAVEVHAGARVFRGAGPSAWPASSPAASCSFHGRGQTDAVSLQWQPLLGIHLGIERRIAARAVGYVPQNTRSSRASSADVEPRVCRSTHVRSILFAVGSVPRRGGGGWLRHPFRRLYSRPRWRSFLRRAARAPIKAVLAHAGTVPRCGQLDGR